MEKPAEETACSIRRAFDIKASYSLPRCIIVVSLRKCGVNETTSFWRKDLDQLTAAVKLGRRGGDEHSSTEKALCEIKTYAYENTQAHMHKV